MSLFPLVRWERIETADSDRALIEWDHYLGPNDRPFGRQEFGLTIGEQLVAVAVSASTVGATCADRSRFEVVELARLATKPGFNAYTRVMLRLWRELAPEIWLREYWPSWERVSASVSYSNETRHKGDIYRFDGWRKFGVVPGSTGGGTYTSKQPREDKALWIYELSTVTRKAIA